jgi:hypothetical protein
MAYCCSYPYQKMDRLLAATGINQMIRIPKAGCGNMGKQLFTVNIRAVTRMHD